MEINYIIESSIFLGCTLFIFRLLLKGLKLFQLNRFFLLLILILSLITPLLNFEFPELVENVKMNSVGLTTSFANEVFNNELDGELIRTTDHDEFSLSQVSTFIYLIITSLLIMRFFFNLGRVVWSLRGYKQKVEGMRVLKTTNEVPYSFFQYLFLSKKERDISQLPKEILYHEQAHAQQLHTFDVILIELIICFFWVNPFLWLLKSEIRENHEYQADQMALSKIRNVQSYASTLLNFNCSTKNSLVSSFSYKLTKKRLIMMYRENSHKAISTLNITMAVVLTVFTFTFTACEKAPKAKSITVVVDPGHGGKDDGAIVTNILEKDLCLAIAQRIKANSENTAVNIILTRENDEFKTIDERIEFTNSIHPDLFLSIHLGFKEHEPEVKEGIEVYVSNEESQKQKALNFGNLFLNELNALDNSPVVMKEAPFRILKGTTCPTILIGAGFMNNTSDMDKLHDVNYQNKLAKRILEAIELATLN